MKKFFLVQNKKNENPQQHQHIRFSPDIKFQLKQTILIFFGKISPKRIKIIRLLYGKFFSNHEIHSLKNIV